jgi:hypothetical protein
MATGKGHRFGSDVRAMMICAQLWFFGSGTLVVCIILSRRARPRCRTSCGLSKLSSSISEDKVDSPWSSLSILLISRSVLSPFCIIRRTIKRRLAITNSILEGWIGSAHIRLAMKIRCPLQCTDKYCLKVGLLFRR